MSIDLQQVAINPTGVTPLYQSDAHSIYWVGVAEESAFRCNVYLIVDGDEVILVDPGSRAHFAQVKERISSVIDPMKVTGAIVCHQDPDVAASLLDWLALNPAIKVYTTPRTHVLLPYYDIEYDYVDVEENSEVTLPSGAVLRFIASPFLHFPGAFTTYDVATQALFSGDIWAALDSDWSLVVKENFDSHRDSMDLFHMDYMASNVACRGYVKQLDGLEIDAILPQHGSIIDSKFVKEAVDYLENVRCGTDLVYPEFS
ncbi:MAG: MBL fold metallo-hydrolase [Gammaproteobacteria bacterium]|jgi:flavorubredoxin|nr:MBL fold metallo-hydrolase [Gammaproteobacteria bacterium]MBT4606005.1 MBL fold metallo-hydrolase [Thiotrichales bacterium]MBT3473594.1 MBL fold metallo-hydrolase [Gammaproteobacteria bacterium]MBT3967928.1 MBL fold metallo-hydrolase [Gammaproteobacteria bacterium]MBT4081915.1 MBL fold metallo-hydrolase [Gammaproteobacteria bacterium]